MGAWGVLMNMRRRGVKRTLEIRKERDDARKEYQEYLAQKDDGRASGDTRKDAAGR